jgi:SAM-dependent methyltransferase
LPVTVQGIDDLELFPGWDRAGNFIKDIILKNNFNVIGDVGGGRLPRIELPFLKKHKLSYYLFDISDDELQRADKAYHKIRMDVACSDADFEKTVVPRSFDLIYSHMLLEHLEDPLQAHRNFFKMLRPGGLSVHMFPSRNNLPLFLNGLIPERMSKLILKILQPHRDTDGQEGKFHAYYKYCGAPCEKLRRTYEAIGFEVVQHTSYAGHEYYKRVPFFTNVERALRKVIIKAKLPIITANLLVLKKPMTS